MRLLHRTLFVFALALAAAVAFTGVAEARARSASAPVIKKVKPMKINIGETLTITGSGFVKGKKRNTVVFMGPSKRVVWVKADTATTKTIKVRLPAKLLPLLTVSNGKTRQTRLRIRVISKRSGRAFTVAKISPLVSPSDAPLGGGPAPGSCAAKALADPNGDQDGDFLRNGMEAVLKTDPCKADTDGDGVTDGYEYQSALDYNRSANANSVPFPYPGKRPYPNPLDGTDANTDFDGDVLTLSEEYQASFKQDFWGKSTQQPYDPSTRPDAADQLLAARGNVVVVSYSDGDQTTDPPNPNGAPSGPPAPSSPSAQTGFDVNLNGVVGDLGDAYSFIDVGGAANVYDPGTDIPGYQNFDGGSFLRDDEKDIDQDGLSNYVEAHGPLMGPSWWTINHPNDGTYPGPWIGTNWLDQDTDGDGVPDGADDEDQDGYSNIEESNPSGLWVLPTEGVKANVQPFNPCLPNDAPARACMAHPPHEPGFAPFKGGSTQPTFHTWTRP